MASSGPKESTIRQLFALSMNRCAFPGCETPIIDTMTGTIMAEVCHIHAQSDGGPRFDLNQTDSERHGFYNLILMCRNHHKVIDAKENLDHFTPDRLREIKAIHESAAKVSGIEPQTLSSAALGALRLTATTYESGAVHMDFRHAEFRVGGEGGHMGGGGGSGGVLTIVGISRLPPDIHVDLNGKDGQAPGGGGGGSGVLCFIGREADSDDQDNGLSVSAFLPVNSVSIEGLLNVLGGGWSYCPVPQLPHTLRLTFACVVEFGQMAPSTLLRLEIVIKDEQGKVAGTSRVDVAAPETDLLVRRTPCFQRVQCIAESYGVWSAELRSGEIKLASIPIEIRQGNPIEI